MVNLLSRLRELYRSIASLPALLVIGILVISCLQASTTDWKVELPDWLAALNISDLDTLRSLFAAVIGGVFTMTVFSYTMVMSVLNRSIASYSPRLVPLILRLRFHQTVLGVATGTILHALLLLMVTVTADEHHFHPPILGGLVSLLLTLATLLLFIYYIHRVSMSIHVNGILELCFLEYRSQIRHLGNIEGVRLEFREEELPAELEPIVRADDPGYLNELSYERLVDKAGRVGGELWLLARPGSWVTAGQPLLAARPAHSAAARTGTDNTLGVSGEEPLEIYTTGFKHLTEVAVKAMSPALNDPGTALTSLHYLEELFRELTRLGPFNTLTGPGGRCRIEVYPIEKLRDDCFEELAAYLNDDPWTKRELAEVRQSVDRMLRQS